MKKLIRRLSAAALLAPAIAACAPVVGTPSHAPRVSHNPQTLHSSRSTHKPRPAHRRAPSTEASPAPRSVTVSISLENGAGQDTEGNPAVVEFGPVGAPDTIIHGYIGDPGRPYQLPSFQLKDPTVLDVEMIVKPDKTYIPSTDPDGYTVSIAIQGQHVTGDRMMCYVFHGQCSKEYTTTYSRGW